MVASAEDVHGVDAALFDGFGEGGALFLYEFGYDAVSELPEVNMAVDDWGIPEFFEIQIHGVLVFFGFINYARWVWSRVEETIAHGTKCSSIHCKIIQCSNYLHWILYNMYINIGVNGFIWYAYSYRSRYSTGQNKSPPDHSRYGGSVLYNSSQPR